MPLTAQAWPCTNCKHNLGRVVRGQLVLKGELNANTNGPCLVVVCPQCGKLKTWFPSLEESLDYILLLMSRKVVQAKQQAQALESSNGRAE